MSDGLIIIDTPDGIAAYRAIAILRALKLEVNTGLRHSRGSVLKLAQREYGIKSKTKAKAVVELEDVLRERGILHDA